jgi:diaminopimelate decarboxylase
MILLFIVFVLNLTFNLMITHQHIAQIAAQFHTPCWIYDVDTIRNQIARLRQFDVIRYAQKACSNTHLLRLMREQGVLVDAVSLGEIERALAADYLVDDLHGDVDDAKHAPIVFTADVLDRATMARVIELNIPVNCGSKQMLQQLGAAHRGHSVWLRINPGFGHGHSRKTNTGGEQSKHGIWHEQLTECLQIIQQTGLNLIGLHMHIGSGVDYLHLQRVCEAMVQQVQHVREFSMDISAISVGGGLSIPYQIGEEEIDTTHYFQIWDAARKQIEIILGHSVQMEIEPGRFLVAQSGKLVSKLLAQKQVGNNFFSLVDAGFNDLTRPAMYGSFHHITAYGPDGVPRAGSLRHTVVAGPLCESGDVFTQLGGGEVVSRDLPICEIGDLIVFHDAGAYGASMSSNYNSRPLIPEVLIDGVQFKLIRRRQTVQELIALEIT